MKVDKLRGIIAERGLSQSKVARIIGIADRTFYEKMKKGSFSVDEAQKMVDLLDIQNPSEIFFTA